MPQRQCVQWTRSHWLFRDIAILIVSITCVRRSLHKFSWHRWPTSIRDALLSLMLLIMPARPCAWIRPDKKHPCSFWCRLKGVPRYLAVTVCWGGPPSLAGVSQWCQQGPGCTLSHIRRLLLCTVSYQLSIALSLLRAVVSSSSGHAVSLLGGGELSRCSTAYTAQEHPAAQCKAVHLA